MMGVHKESGSQWIAPPPSHDGDAEVSILGAIFINDNYFVEAAQKLAATDFFDNRHRAIFHAMRELAIREIPIDPLTVKDELERRGKLEHVGGLEYLTSLPDGLPRVTNIGHYADIVKKHSARRQLLDALVAGQKRAEDLQEDPSVIITDHQKALAEINANPSVDWRTIFHTYEETVNAPLLKFAIRDFLQCDAATLLAGLSGQYKTWLLLSIVKALLGDRGKKLWGTFEVMEPSTRVLYLIPESGLGPFIHRVDKLGLMPHVRDGRMLYRTLSKGPAPKLQDPRLLVAAQGADVLLDTCVRFIEGDESSASDNNRGLAADIFALQTAGARSLLAAAHSPKAFAQQNFMELENMVRGSGDISAAFATAWGVRQLPGDIAHIQNIKPRDFEPCGPFQLAARPHLDQIGDFQLHKAPGDCGFLADEMPSPKSNSGASAESREMKNAKLALLRRLYAENPHMTWMEVIAAFQREKMDIARGTIRKYRSELGL